ncbi:MAG: alpha/beta hydrolase [Rubrivivax sp.]|nr:alpha/beta hydrolase [Rubrivivax sp.]
MPSARAQLHIAARDATAGDTVPAELFDPAWEPPQSTKPRRRVVDDWNQYMAVASQVVGRFHGQFVLRHFDYRHPTWLQPATPRRMRREYPVSVAYTEWGNADGPLLVCCGGVANVATRFNYLASDLARDFRVVCMDWLGRGRSGWLAAQEDYGLRTYAEQLRQIIVHLGGGPLTVLGSSMGGSAAIQLISRHPGLVDRLILNDVGPHIPGRRRRRRAQTIARHYVFRSPGDLLRKVGASAKNDGPVSDDIRFNLTFHQTKWSDEEGGRVYRHDVRALQAYREDSQQSLLQWDEWQRVNVPVLLIHGLQSDALLESTIARMRRGKDLALMHIPDTGHSPLLADRNQTWFIREWLLRPHAARGEWSALHAPMRDMLPGTPIAFAPLSVLR